MNDKHPNLVKIGKTIRQARLDRDISQERLAEIANLGRTYMGRIERGEQNLSIQNLIKIAFALKLEVGDLVPSRKKLKSPD